MEFLAEGGPTSVLDETRAGKLVDELLRRLGERRRVLIVPPDVTRLHSWAGPLTAMLYERLKDRADVQILPATGSHRPMTADEIARMFPRVPVDRFHPRDWRKDLVRIGEVPAEFVRNVSEGRVDYGIEIEVDRRLVHGQWDLILSVGQLVPHEVVGIANHAKNLLIGLGGPATIHKSHFLGAVYGMERMMGRVDTPVRAVLDYASEHFCRKLPLVYLLTVRGRDAEGNLVTRGLYAGDDGACFRRAAVLCRQCNLDLLPEPVSKVVVHLEPSEFKSTWVGNKAIYRTRMALADGAELIILGPGVREFGEDAEIDRLIRKFGYRGTPQTLEAVRLYPELAANLSAAAHLIHGSSEGRFKITWCPGQLSRDEIENVGFAYGDLTTMQRRYDPARMKDGWNTLADGERVYFISNPGLGLWGVASKFGAD